MNKQVSFTEAAKYLKCPPQWLSDQLERKRIDYSLDDNGKYLISLRSLQTFERFPCTPERRKSERPPTLTNYVRALRTAELRQEAKDAGMGLREYIEMVEESTNGIQLGSF